MTRRILYLNMLSAALCPFLSAQDKNLLKDPGFEEADSPVWRVNGTWAGMSKEDSAYIKQYDASAPFSGKYSLKLSDKWPEQRPHIVQTIPCSGAESYNLSFQVKGDIPKIIRVCAYYKIKEKLTDMESHNVNISSEWEKRGVIFHKFPKDTETVTIAIWPSAGQPPANGSGETGTIWLDNVSLIQGERSISAKELQESCRPVSLKAAANKAFQDKIEGDGKDGWFDGGESDFRAFPFKEKIFADIPLTSLILRRTITRAA